MSKPKPFVAHIRNQGATATLYLYDVIGKDFFGDGVRSDDVSASIDNMRENGVDHLDLRINSVGGDLYEGLGIYNALERFPGTVAVSIDALAASAASLIAMAGDSISIASNASVMIHEAAMYMPGQYVTLSEFDGRAQQFASEKTPLEIAQRNLLAAYSRTKLSPDELTAAMIAETWYTAEDAVAAGFADEITGALSMAACIEPGRFKNTPRKYIIAHSLAPETPEPIREPAIQRRRAAAGRRLELTKLRTPTKN